MLSPTSICLTWRAASNHQPQPTMTWTPSSEQMALWKTRRCPAMRLSRSHPETLPAWMKSKTAVFMFIVKKKTILGGWSEAITYTYIQKFLFCCNTITNNKLAYPSIGKLFISLPQIHKSENSFIQEFREWRTSHAVA